MSAQSIYRRIPAYWAGLLAVVISFCVAIGSGILGAFTLDFVLEKLDGPPSIGGGVLVIIAIPNIVIPVFVSLFSVLVNWHHAASWRAPASAFALGSILTWLWTPFPVTFAPVVLGTGALALLLNCWWLRRKGNPNPEHV